MIDVVVIGAGLFGSVIAASLSRSGYTVTTVDDARPNRGSRPAACLMKSSWFSSMGHSVYDPALLELDGLYGVHDIQFRVNGLASATVHWVDPRQILQVSDHWARVEDITKTGLHGSEAFVVRATDLQSGNEVEFQTSRVVVATGVWAEELVHTSVPIRGQAGVAFLWPDVEMKAQPFISVWAPYKQIVAFNRGDGLWCGDGSAILEKNWSAQHEKRSLDRCSKAVNMYSMPRVMYGVRPYAEARPCLLEEVERGLWVATGGAKNGTLAAGWCGAQLSERLA